MSTTGIPLLESLEQSRAWPVRHRFAVLRHPDVFARNYRLADRRQRDAGAVASPSVQSLPGRRRKSRKNTRTVSECGPSAAEETCRRHKYVPAGASC